MKLRMAVTKHSKERLSQQLIAQYGASSIISALLTNKSELTKTSVSTLYGLSAQYGVLRPYSHKHEFEADRMNLVFLAMAGDNLPRAITF